MSLLKTHILKKIYSLFSGYSCLCKYHTYQNWQGIQIDSCCFIRKIVLYEYTGEIE